MFTKTECDIDSISHDVFRKLFGQAKERVGTATYSDAPLTNTGNLVPRRVVRVRSVGVKRMYDLEVAHPKHNFLLSNGAVTSNSHSVCYMDIAYPCAWLKHYYPLEWWTAVLSNADRKDVDEKFWRYVGPMVLMPDVSKSQGNFVIEGNKIRAPAWLVHGIGEKAHKLLTELAPFRDVADFVTKIEEYRKKNSTVVTKINKETGEQKQTVRLGHNPLNDSIVSKLIICGVLDSLFPATDEAGLPMDITDKLSAYLKVSSEIRKKKPKGGSKFSLQSEVSKFQYIKTVMPAYSAPLIPMFRAQYPSKFRDFSENLVYYRAQDGDDYGLLTGDQFEWLEELETLPDTHMKVALPAYVLSQRVFKYQNQTKTACELVLDIEGHRRKFVRWPSRETGLPAIFKSNLEGALVVALLNRRKASEKFFFNSVETLFAPLQDEKPEESPND